MPSTVFTPECLSRMVAKGTYRKVKLADLNKEGRERGFDEIFYFRFPSTDCFNEGNGDGDFMEVHDYTHIKPTSSSSIPNLVTLFTAREEIAANTNTEVYVR